MIEGTHGFGPGLNIFHGGGGVGGPPRDSLMANYNKITGLVCLFSARISSGRVAVIVAKFCCEGLPLLHFQALTLIGFIS